MKTNTATKSYMTQKWKLILGFLSSLLIILPIFASNLAHAEELLEVDQAFELKQPTVEDQKIIIHWNIADDYKLYKDKMGVSATEITLDVPQFSKSKTVDDALFGKTEVFNQTARITIPYSGSASATELTVNTKVVLIKSAFVTLLKRVPLSLNYQLLLKQPPQRTPLVHSRHLISS